MKTIIFSFLSIISVNTICAQNLVVNPGAESLPRGTGWTIVSAGATACVLAPSSNYVNWTMIPDGSANYPFDHTTVAAGGHTFFSGCSGSFQGPFELQQDIDVSGDAANIDVWNMQYIFSGYMQTPVSNQTDIGWFIVDYLNASNTVLGASYTSSQQGNFFGSGNGWNLYTNTRLAPPGTRKVRIRLLTQIFFNVPAINVYFDDISLVKASVLPVTLISFTGNEDDGKINLLWRVADEINLKQYEVEKSTDAVNFTNISVIKSGKREYSFIDKNTSSYIDKYYYRLKMTDADGKFSYSTVLSIKIKGQVSLAISPNPANNFVTVSGFEKPGKINIINSNGSIVYNANTTAQAMKINIASLPAGLYVLRFTDGKATSFKKFIVQNK